MKTMNKILTIKRAIDISKKLRTEGKQIVLAGGCFDILHLGHIEFLEKAKDRGNVLFVLLESDETIRQIKGNHRPINAQQDRAKVLSAFESVDYVILLPYLKTDTDYDDLIIGLKPTIIATTKGDPKRHHKERQAKKVGAKVIDVIEKKAKQSTSRLSKLILEDYYL